MYLCKSLEKSGLGEKEIDLYNQQLCTSCHHNQMGEFECKECDDILCQNAKRHIPIESNKYSCCNTNLILLP